MKGLDDESKVMKHERIGLLVNVKSFLPIQKFISFGIESFELNPKLSPSNVGYEAI